MIDLEPILSAAQNGLKTRNLSELLDPEGFGRGTEGLNQFGWTRLYKILIQLMPFTRAANPQAVIELCAEVKALRAENASLRIGQLPGTQCRCTACDPRVATATVYVPKHWPP